MKRILYVAATTYPPLWNALSGPENKGSAAVRVLIACGGPLRSKRSILLVVTDRRCPHLPRRVQTHSRVQAFNTIP